MKQSQIQILFFLILHLGVSNYKIIDNKSSLMLGFSAYHLNRPNQSFISTKEALLKPKYVFHSTYYSRINSKTDISPTLYSSSQSEDYEIVIGSGFTYKFNQTD